MKSTYSRVISILMIAAMCLGMSACSNKEVSSSTLEDARSQSLQNGLTVAKAYVRENPRLKGMDVVGHADEHQTADCPQGSGWAYLSAMRNLTDADGKITGTEKVKLVCSTVSASLGCYREQDFKETAFASGKCDAKIPFPLPKVIGKS